MDDVLTTNLAEQTIQIDTAALDDMEALVAREMQALRREFIAQLPERLRRIEETWQALSPAAAGPALLTLYRLVHSLNGSSGTLGFSGLGATARGMEHYLRTLMDQDRLLSADERTEVEVWLHVLDRLVQECVASAGDIPPVAEKNVQWAA